MGGKSEVRRSERMPVRNGNSSLKWRNSSAPGAISNRHSLKVETNLSCSKHSAALLSNRHKFRGPRSGIRPRISSPDVRLARNLL